MILLVPLICHLARGAAVDWQGTWTDPVWNGKIYICVTTVNGIDYGMAGMSNIGYLKGTIDSNDHFSGNYYIQGREQRRGSFNFTMSGFTASAVLMDAGNAASYSHTATGYTKENSAEPTDFQCLRTDDDWVAGKTNLYITGTFQQVIPPSEDNQHISYDDGTIRRSSYVYDWGGEINNGYIVGHRFENGLLSVEQWYENTRMGIELTIFKNDTAFYVYWMNIEYSSQFVYADLNGQPEGTVSYGVNLKMQTSQDYTNYDEWNCYQLQFSSELASCLGNGVTTNAGDDDVATKTEQATYATLSFGVINFVLIIVVVMMKQKVVFVSGGANNEMHKV